MATRSSDGGPPCHKFSEELGLVKWSTHWYVTEISYYRKNGTPNGYGGAFASKMAAALYAQRLVEQEGFR